MTLMQDGTVLIVGGIDTPTAAEISRPSGRCVHADCVHTDLAQPGTGISSPNSGADIYDPQTRSFTQAGAMQISRALHTATLLGDGRVLICFQAA